MQFNTRFHDVNELSFLTLVDSSIFEKYSQQFPSPALQSLMSCYSSIFKKEQQNVNFCTEMKHIMVLVF